MSKYKGPIIDVSTERKVFIGIGLATLLIIAGGVALVSRQQSKEASVPEDQILSRNSIHWHPKLAISTKREKKEIPANLGIGGIHQPIHTHDTSGTLHVEVQGIVTKEEITLGKFFQVWGKQFNARCIFDTCSEQEGTVKLLVNGQENKEFENYQMKDNDNIEIRYE